MDSPRAKLSSSSTDSDAFSEESVEESPKMPLILLRKLATHPQIIWVVVIVFFFPHHLHPPHRLLLHQTFQRMKKRECNWNSLGPKRSVVILDAA
jgi:hypothetical protein